MIPDLFWIVGPWRGRLAIAARPGEAIGLRMNSSGWRMAGINVVVSLLESDEAAQLNLLDESKVAEAKGIRFISFPIPDRGVPTSVPAAVSLMAERRKRIGRRKERRRALPSRHWSIGINRGGSSGHLGDQPRRCNRGG